MGVCTSDRRLKLYSQSRRSLRRWTRTVFCSTFILDTYPTLIPRFGTSANCHQGIWQNISGGESQRQHWDLRAYGNNDPGSDQACLEEMEQRLASAVRMRLVGDVPIGALLSGPFSQGTR